MKVGFIGLGIMGRPMAEQLVRGGHELYVFSRSRPELAGAASCSSSGEVAQRADVVITMLPDTPDVASVLFGDQGVASALSPGKIVIDMSSISPLETRRFAERIAELGCEYLDAPVSGGEVGAKAASLTIMVGGSEAAFERIKPLFELMGRSITRVGPSGAGQICKVANQIIVAGTLEAVAEALVFAAKAGAEPARVRQALLGGFASSRILEVHGERMLRRQFQPGFRVALHQKDLELALSGARELGLSLPLTALCQQLFSAVAAAGGRDADHSAIVRALEMLARHELGETGSD
jgi:2-hydroxy-3-oxopropionate reductase